MKCRSQRGLAVQSRAATTCSGEALREPLHAGRPPVTDLVPVPVPLQVENSERSRMACRIATRSGDPTAFPHGIDGSGATPPGRVACACTCRPSPMPIEASREGGVAPVHGRMPRSGSGAPEAVVQLQDSQPYTEALARTSKRRFGAHAPHCLMCPLGSASTRPDPPHDPSPEGVATGSGWVPSGLRRIGQIGQDLSCHQLEEVACRR